MTKMILIPEATAKQVLEALKIANQWVELKEPAIMVEKAITALREALAEQALQKMADNEKELGLDYMGKPIAWLYPEGLEALKSGKCWTAYGAKQDAQCSIPVYLNDAVAPRVEPAATQSGGGFESLPASPQAKHQEALNKFAEDSVWDGEGP